MSRLVTILGCCALLATPSALAARRRPGAPKRSHVHGLVGPAPDPATSSQHGLMAKTVAAFRADDTLTQGELAAARRRPHQAAGRRRPPTRAAPVTVTQLDARLVRALGLSDAAAAFTAGAQAAGLAARPASAPRRSRACSGCARTIPPSRRPRAPADRPGHPRGDRLLGRADPALRGLGDAVRRGRGRDLRAAGARRTGRRACSTRPSASSASRTSGAARARRRRRRSASRRAAASTARASSGASTSCRRTRAAPPCARRSRAGRPTR